MTSRTYTQSTFSATFDQELCSVREQLSLSETEDTWDDIARAITHLSTVLKSSAAQFPREFSTTVRSLARPIVGAVNSERSRLSGVAVEFLHTLANSLGRQFEPLLPLFLPALLALCTRPNKVFIARARACITAFIEHTQSPTILPYLTEAVKDKSVSLRLAAAESVLACLNSFNPPDLEKEPRAREVEAMVKITATDPSAEVRKIGRRVFEAYKILLPRRVASFTEPLTPIMKKYLDIKAESFPSNGACAPSTTVTRRSASSNPRAYHVKPTANRDPERPATGSRGAARSLTPHEPPIRAKTGPMRPSSDDAANGHPGHDNGKERVVGGARRVLLIPPSSTTHPTVAGPLHVPSVMPESVVGEDMQEAAPEVSDHPVIGPLSKSNTRYLTTKSTSNMDAGRKQATQWTKSKAIPSAAPVQGKKVGTTQVRDDSKPIWGRAAPKLLGRASTSDKGAKKQKTQKVAVQTNPTSGSGSDVLLEETPLPPSPKDAAPAILVPLPPSPTFHPRDDVVENPITPERAPFEDKRAMAQTPISALLASIEQGFFSPSSPLLPPQPRLRQGAPLDLPKPIKPLYVGGGSSRLLDEHVAGYE